MSAPAPPVDAGRDFYLGQPGAKVEIVAYGEYGCPYSRSIRDILLRVRDRLAEHVVFAYRQMPPGPPDAAAALAARAAVAAGRQGAFWEMHGRLFECDGLPDREQAEALARELGLDLDRFARDLDSAETLEQVGRDRQSAAEAGVGATPALFINGRPYAGAWDEASILEAVERPLGLRLRGARQRFFAWAASGGLVLVAATIAALMVTNLGFHEAYEAIRATPRSRVRRSSTRRRLMRPVLRRPCSPTRPPKAR